MIPGLHGLFGMDNLTGLSVFVLNDYTVHDFSVGGGSRVRSVEDDSHLFEGVALGLRVGEPDGDDEHDEDGHEDEVIFPSETDCQ